VVAARKQQQKEMEKSFLVVGGIAAVGICAVGVWNFLRETKDALVNSNRELQPWERYDSE
jgi:hypothetical protein